MLVVDVVGAGQLKAQGGACMGRRHWGFPKLGAPFWGAPNNKDYDILGSTLGSLF